VQNLSGPIKKTILPFAIPEKDRFRPLSKEMEMAAIFILAERNRKKGESRFLKKTKEKLCFIAETCYPIWLIPWKGKTLIFDGLEFSNQTVYYDIIPDIKAFETDIQASSKSREAYVACLSQNGNYFQKFTGKQEKTIEGLITDQSFVQDFMNYLNDTEGNITSKTAKAILSPMLEKCEVKASIDKLTEIREKIIEEIKILNQTMKLLSTTSRMQVKNLQAEMRKNDKFYDNKIKKTKPKVTEKIKKIQEKRDEDVTRISQKYTKKLRRLQQKRVRAEKTLIRLSREIERIEANIKTCRERKDETNEFQLAKKHETLKKRISPLKKQIKEIDKALENVDETKKIEVTRARMKPDDQIEEARKILLDIEAEKEAKTRVAKKELTDLEDMTSAIIKQIDVMVKTKENTLNELENLGISHSRRKWSIVYIPCYFVCYETEEEKRYVMYPPSNVGSMCIKTKLKGVFGSGKMNDFMQCRSESIASLLDKLIDLTLQNPVFEKEITEAALKANILQEKELIVGVKRGINQLKTEGWISENEVQIRDGKKNNI
jgi:hypothetical protein